MSCERCKQLQAEVDELKEILRQRPSVLQPKSQMTVVSNTHNTIFSPITPEWVKEKWNLIPGVQRCRKLTGPVLDRVKGKIKEHPEQVWWLTYFRMIQASDFLCGKVVHWKADLWWACGPRNMAKVFAGNYENQASPASGKGGKTAHNVNKLLERMRNHEQQ